LGIPALLFTMKRAALSLLIDLVEPPVPNWVPTPVPEREQRRLLNLFSRHLYFLTPAVKQKGYLKSVV
jgi:hypothetical protein